MFSKWKRQREADLNELISLDDQPNMKRAAATIMDLRIRVEVQRVIITCSVSLNMTLITAYLIGKLA